MSGSSNVNVSFKVSGGDLQSYMDKIKQKADSLAKDMIDNAKKETDIAKDQLKSYEKQIALLERKQKAEAESARIAADFNRNARISDIRASIGNQYDNLDDQLFSGKINKKTHQAKVEALDRSEISQTQGAEDDYKDELKRVKEQERDSKTLIRAMRENIDVVKVTSQNELNQMRRGDESLVDAIDENDDPSARLADKLASQQHAEEVARQKGKEEKDSSGAFSGLLKALAIDRVGGMVAGIPQANNELDYIKPMMATIGMAVGGLLGNAADAVAGMQVLGFGLGQTAFGALGTQLGEKFGEFAGSAIERSYRGRDELTTANYRLQGLTGVNYGVNAIDEFSGAGTGISSITKDLAQYGADFKETSELQYKLAMTQGTSRNLMGGAENMIAAQQGLGINPEIFLGLTELVRSSSKGNRDVLQLIGGVASAGKGNIFSQDRTFLGEFLQKNFTQMQKTLLQTQNRVASGTTFDILKRFDAMGGPFAARDSRSGGLINTVQNALVNPGSDNMKALSMIMLRRDDPNMDPYQLLKEQQKGLGSATYLRSMSSAVEGMGGPAWMKKLNMANMIGMGGNLDAAETFYKNRGRFKSRISQSELQPDGEYSEGSIRALGQSQTSVYTKATAEIENEFIKSAVGGIEVVGSKMITLMGKMMDGVQTYIEEKIRSMIRGGSDAQDKSLQNRTKSPLTNSGIIKEKSTDITGGIPGYLH